MLRFKTLLSLILSILGILITIFFVVGIHELGHFLVARWVGVKVTLFSIGFGKPLFRWHDKKGTEYILAPIPLGGYIKMLDEQEAPVKQEDRAYAYNNQPFYKKFLIVSAGPLFNLIFALVIYWIIFMIGFVGMIPLIGKVTPNSIAAEAGIKPNQEIIQIDNSPIDSWMAVLVHILVRAGDTDTLQVRTRDIETAQLYNYNLNLTSWKLNELKPDPLESLGITPFEPTIPPIIGQIKSGSPADGLFKPKDKILSINQIPINDWITLGKIIEENPNQTMSFTLLRDNKTQILKARIGTERQGFFKQRGVLGIGPSFVLPAKMLREHRYNPLQAFVHAWRDTKVFILMNAIVFGKLITGKVSFASLGGPISIFQSAGTSINLGILPFLNFLAFISIAIGLVNVLPIPGLDGGHLLFQTIEAVIRRPISPPVQLLAYRFGLILLFLLLTQAIVNDIMRL